MNKNTATQTNAGAATTAQPGIASLDYRPNDRELKTSWADSTPAQRCHSNSGEACCLFACIVGIFALLAVFVALVISATN